MKFILNQREPREDLSLLQCEMESNLVCSCILSFKSQSAVPVAALWAFDLERVTKPDALAAAAPMTGHLVLPHVEMTRHGTNAEVFEAACAASWRRARLRKTYDSSRIGQAVFWITFSHSEPETSSSAGCR